MLTKQRPRQSNAISKFNYTEHDTGAIDYDPEADMDQISSFEGIIVIQGRLE